MDVTSLVIAVALVGQTTSADRYQNFSTPGGASLSTPTSTYAPSPASPGYTPPPPSSPLPPTGSMPPSSPSYAPAAMPPDPLFTAAAQRRTSTTGAAPGSLPANAVAPISTPVPTNNTATGPSPGGPAASTYATAAAPTVPDSARAVELVREAISLPQGATIEGKGRTLIETLAPQGDRRRQFDAVVAYWRLAADTAEYHFDWQQTQFLEHVQKTMSGRGGDATTAAEVGSRLATSQARLRESELRLYDAQYELAQRAGADVAVRPLTVDLPHTGSYKTQFERLFGGGVPAGRIVLLNRTLPMRQQIVNVRADSVWAAQNGYEQTFAAFQQSRLPAEEVLAALDDFRRRRSEFITAVRRYNEEIAEYAFASAPATISTATLVGMLLKNPTKPAAGTVSDASWDAPSVSSGVMPATYLAPSIPTGGPTPAPPMATPRPDPISAPVNAPMSSQGVPQNFIPSAANAVSPAAYTPYGDPAPLSPGSVPPPITPEMQRPAMMSGGSLPIANAPTSNPLRGEPTLAPPPFSPSPATASAPSVVPTTASNPYAPTTINSNSPTTLPPPSSAPPGLLPPFAPQQSQPAPLPQSRYKVHTTNFQSAAPSGMTRAQATQELVESLYDPQAAPMNGTPISLDACLAKVSSHERTEVLATYWSAAEQRARYRAWAEAVETLGRVSSSNPRVQSATLAAGAERFEALVALCRARMHLTELVQDSHDEPWLLPDTLPHGGRYDTKSAALAKTIAARPQLKRDVDRLPTLHETLQYRAEAVTAARSAAQSVVGRLGAQQTTPHVAIEAIERQAQETCELLKVTTRYNLTIADYALGVLPTTTPRDTLVSALVVGRNTVASRP